MRLSSGPRENVGRPQSKSRPKRAFAKTSSRYAANERASLFIGNAGGLEIRVNGKPLGPIGPRGQLRTVVITPEGVSITNPREKKEPPPSAANPGQ